MNSGEPRSAMEYAACGLNSGVEDSPTFRVVVVKVVLLELLLLLLGLVFSCISSSDESDGALVSSS